MSSDAKGSHNPSVLPTPQPSAEPEDRAKADQEKSAASSEVNVKQEDDGDHQSAAAAVQQHPEAPPASAGETKENEAGGATSDVDARLERVAAETKRILDCPKDSYADILGVKSDSTERQKLDAWRDLGCLLHENSTDHKGAKKAFKTEDMGVDYKELEQVLEWDGKAVLSDPQKDDEKDANGDTGMVVDSTPVPPVSVKDIYNEATPALHQLGKDSTDPDALELLQNLNAKISTFNAAEKKTLGADGADISLDRWTIPLGFFPPHYNFVREKYKILENDRTNEEARKAIATEKQLIDNLIARDHFPQSWTVLAADEYLQMKDKEPATAAIHYPWPTDKADDGSVIIGVRKQGTGHRVLIGRQENDRTIYRLEAASEVGSSRVTQYKAMEGFKKLEKGQSEWTKEDRDDFKELLWVTKSQTKRKNTAAGKKNASADCCVNFKQKGIQILTLSSLRRVLGHGDANKMIKEVCERDGFLPPWEAGNISEFHDPSALEKDRDRRRALRDAQAASLAKNRLNQPEQSLGGPIKKENHEQLDERLGRLENDMSEMKAETTKLTQMFMAFMAAVTPILEKAK
ncbi:hypothetical protein CSUB01_07529 [Colletotrichum sublineola]|uniref:Uncharacterized protein n=1 Tax=Colletotrichum sublineola TaxID=1173701 RepID=A0A066X9D2_COLSU|nr:hypothetical protein CSUB01_07529 [Colletotrichum sublineola]